MKTVKVYNKIQGRNKIFGLEFLDLLFLLLIFMVVFVLSANLIANLAIVITAYLALRIYKKGKAPHWTGSVVRFLTRPMKYPVKYETEKDIFET